MDSLIFIVTFLFILYFVIQTVTDMVKGFLTGAKLNEVKIPNEMQVFRDIRRVGISGGFTGTIRIKYNPKIDKVFPIKAKDEEELEQKYKEILGKYKLP
jgi:hypothetical protein